MILTWTVFLPLIGALVIGVAAALAPSPRDRQMRDNVLKTVALVVSLATFLLSLTLLGKDAVLEVTARWIPFLGASFHLELDGISIWLFLLTTFLMPICVLASWRNITTHKDHDDAYPHEEEEGERGVAGFLVSLLLLETAMLGTFAAFDLLLFFLFWELMLIPMYFLIGIWGSPGMRDTFLFGRIPDRIYATIKFVLYTMAGSALMLVAIIYLRLQAGSFDLNVIMDYVRAGGLEQKAQFCSSGRSSSPSRSRCPSSRSTRGCRTRTHRLRPPGR